MLLKWRNVSINSTNNSYQNRVVSRANIEVYSPDAKCHNNVDNKPRPVVSKIPWHVDEGSLCERERLHQKASLAPSWIQHSSFLWGQQTTWILSILLEIWNGLVEFEWSESAEENQRSTYEPGHLIYFLLRIDIVLWVLVVADQPPHGFRSCDLLERIVRSFKLHMWKGMQKFSQDTYTNMLQATANTK